MGDGVSVFKDGAESHGGISDTEKQILHVCPSISTTLLSPFMALSSPEAGKLLS